MKGIVNILMTSRNNKHIWNIRVGKKEYLIQDILNNYELLGDEKEEIQAFLQDYTFYKKTAGEWICELKNSRKGKYLLILFFEADQLIKVNYSVLEYKAS
jgi:hypothetical protein